MNITKDTPVSLLCHSDDVTYIELDAGELAHWKYARKERLPNGKWRYYYVITEHQVVHPNNIERDYDKSEYKIKDMTSKEVKTHQKSVRFDRYLEAARAWVDSRLGVPVGDLFTGKRKPLSWKQAKEVTDGWHSDDDPATFISDKYRKSK